MHPGSLVAGNGEASFGSVYSISELMRPSTRGWDSTCHTTGIEHEPCDWSTWIFRRGVEYISSDWRSQHSKKVPYRQIAVNVHCSVVFGSIYKNTRNEK